MLAGMVVSSHAEAPPMRDVTTHDQLIPKLRQAEQNDPMKNMPAVTGADPYLHFVPMGAEDTGIIRGSTPQKLSP